MELIGEAERDLRDYLLAHERYIAHGIEDFGDLRLVFECFIGRPPSFKVLGATTT